MSGVKRFTMFGPHLQQSDGQFVYASDYDRDTQDLRLQCGGMQMDLDELRTANQRLETELANLKEDRDQQYDMKVKARAQRDAVTAANQRLEGEVKRLNSVLWAVSVQVDGNIRPTVRDLVNRLAGVNNGADPNDIYQYCDAIDAALRGNGGE